MNYTPKQLENPIRTPSGSCPIRFDFFCNQSKNQIPPTTVIIAWFWELRHLGLSRGQFLTAEAIAYYARYQFSPSGDTLAAYEEIRDTIYDYSIAINDPFSPARKENEK